MRMSLEEIFLQVTTDESRGDRRRRGGRPPQPRAPGEAPSDACVTSRDRRQGAAVLLRLADRLHHHRPVRAAVRPVLLRLYLTGLRAAQSLQMRDGRRRDQRQPGDDPRRPAERRRDHPVRHADDHDADLRRGEAVRHDRAAADLAAHRPGDHPRQVPRRDGLYARCWLGDAPLHRDPVHLRQPEWRPIVPAISGCCCWAAASSRSGCSSRA